ncbi:unnamed protein product [Larinioides sclopetarius]|uniref:C2H2-type domain-containing protein n=1 Tax=Larinioides sclopetarius TaxID=280406 RepID=A0AAV2AGF0_9ARAC
MCDYEWNLCWICYSVTEAADHFEIHTFKHKPDEAKPCSRCARRVTAYFEVLGYRYQTYSRMFFCGICRIPKTSKESLRSHAIACLKLPHVHQLPKVRMEMNWG